MAMFLAVLAVAIALAFGASQEKFNDSFDWRIVGGTNAKEGQFPYQVSLRKGNVHGCGGSIINNRWIVTAAHCVENASAASFNVVVGTTTLNAGGTKYDLESIIVHNKYYTLNENKEIRYNDIALLKTKKSIVFGKTVAAIPIGKEIVGEADVVLSGWGLTSYPGGSASNNLKYLNSKTITVAECNKKLKPGSAAVINTQICTLNKKGEGACIGDSGGPLAGSGKLVGVISGGEPCALGYPDIYTRVSSFATWIENNAK